MFPEATKEALDLLDKMLRFNPDERITLKNSLKHAYFDDLPFEDEDNAESACAYDFLYENEELDNEELRELILHEILLYHDDKIYNDHVKAKERYIKKMKKSNK